MQTVINKIWTDWSNDGSREWEIWKSQETFFQEFFDLWEFTGEAGTQFVIEQTIIRGIYENRTQ